GVLARERGRVDARRPVDEEARAHQDAVAVGLNDAAVDPVARPEVVARHDQPFHPFHRPTSTACSTRGLPAAARSAAARKEDARCNGASGTPLKPGMLDMSTTYVRPSLSIKSTPYRSIPNARPQRSAMSACSAVGVNGSPYFSASVRAGKTFRTPKSRSPIT